MRRTVCILHTKKQFDDIVNNGKYPTDERHSLTILKMKASPQKKKFDDTPNRYGTSTLSEFVWILRNYSYLLFYEMSLAVRQSPTKSSNYFHICIVNQAPFPFPCPFPFPQFTCPINFVCLNLSPILIAFNQVPIKPKRNLF